MAPTLQCPAAADLIHSPANLDVVIDLVKVDSSTVLMLFFRVLTRCFLDLAWTTTCDLLPDPVREALSPRDGESEYCMALLMTDV